MPPNTSQPPLSGASASPPTVSFVVTVYNKAAYLPLVIRSMDLQRGDFRREYVFVDDGSDDGSVALIRQLTAGQEVPVKIVEQANQGASAATNAGVAAAAGAWIKLVDGDDLLVPGATQWLLDACQRCGAEHAYGDLQDFDWPAAESGRLDPLAGPFAAPPETLLSADAGLSRFIRNCPANSTSILVSKAHYQAAGGCDVRLVSPDQMLFLRLFAAGPGVHLAGPVGLIPGAAPGRLSGQKRRSRYESVLALYYLMAETPGISRRHKREAHARALARAYRFHRRLGGRGPVSAHLWRYVKSKLRFPAGAAEEVYQALSAFTEDGAVERPEAWKPGAIRARG